jgi:hypothetical protein
LRIIDCFSEIQNKIKSSFIPQLPLELAVIKAVGEGMESKQSTRNASPARNASVAGGPGETGRRSITKQFINETKDQQPVISHQPQEENNSTNVEEVSNDENSKNITLEMVKNKWRELLDGAKPYNHSLAVLLSNCQAASVKDNIICIATKYSFYKDKLNEEQNKLTIEKVFAKILGTKVRIKVLSEDEAGIKIHPVKSSEAGAEQFNRVKQQPAKESQSLLNDAMNIMGGKIVD